MSNNYILPSVSAFGFVLVSTANSVFAQDSMLTPIKPLDFVGTIAQSANEKHKDKQVPAFSCNAESPALLSDEDRLNRMFNSVVVVNSAKGLGSGVIIDQAQGYIVTNHHVLKKGETTVNLYDPYAHDNKSDPLKVTVIGSDEKTDVAVLQVQTEFLQACATPAQKDVKYDDDVVAIGHPYGNSFSMSSGVVSHPKRYRKGLAYIQSDTSVNIGNSGGPLFNNSGEIVGVNNHIIAPKKGGSVGLSFTIPIKRVFNVAEDLILHGQRMSPWIGVSVKDIGLKQRAALQLQESGVFIESVKPHGPFANAGLGLGDILIEIDGISTHNVFGMLEIIQAGDPGDSFSVKYQREGQEYTSVVVSEAHEEYVARTRSLGSEGATSVAVLPAPQN